jgi:polysaccharide biosynthesis protein PslG
MTRLPPSRSNSNAGLLMGLWLGLTLVAGIGIFALIYWAMGGFAAATPVPTALPVAISTTVLPTPVVAVTTPSGSGGGGETSACNYPGLPASGFGYGIQSHVFGGGDPNYFLGVVREKLGLFWVKMQVRWRDLEKTQGNVDWGTLDYAMKAACDKGVRVMLSVLTAPDWTHASPMPVENGEAPPDDYNLYANFVGQVVDRYKGQVGAIEVWNEANLEREWNTRAGISAPEYVKLLQITYTAIKSRDPNIVVIAGAPSPTGANITSPEGRPIVIDDATYLTQFVQAGGLAFADCMGTHSNGTNLPPTADGAHPPGDGSGFTFKGPWNSPHYSWALKSQVEKYASILPPDKKQCVTEFGYASAVDGKYPAIFGFAADVSEKQQGEYLVQAFNWLRDSGYVKMAFLFNLDYGPLGGDPSTDDNVLYSLLYRNGAPRPAFDAISAMPKP